MPLPVVDPTRHSPVFKRVMTRFARSAPGKFLAQRVAAKTDPWLTPVSGGKLSWGMFAIPSATLTTTGANFLAAWLPGSD